MLGADVRAPGDSRDGLGAFVLLMVAAIGLGQTAFNPTHLAWGSLLFQAVVVSVASLLFWFWLLGQYQVSQVGVLSFMTPLFGLAFGGWLLNEPLEPSFIAGSVLVLAGILQVNGLNLLGFRAGKPHGGASDRL